MEAILAQIASGEGVTGAWVSDHSGAVLGAHWHAGMDESALLRAGQSVGHAGYWLQQQYGGWEMLAVRTTEGLLLVRNLQHAFLGIVAHSEVNPAFLNVTLNLNVRQLKLRVGDLVRVPVGADAEVAEGRVDAVEESRDGGRPGGPDSVMLRRRREAPVSQRVLDDLTRALAEHLGPAAQVLIKRTFKRMNLGSQPLPRSGLSEFVSLLQERIESEAGRQTFRQAARRIRQLYDV